MKSDDSLEHLRIASPCSVSWAQMTGDEQVRFCHLCNLNVYNLGSMTQTEVTALISKSEGRVCARLYRRADGTIITKDCPVGLRAMRRRAARMAGAVFATLLSLCSAAFGQKQSSSDQDPGKQSIISTRTVSESASATGTISGAISDPQDGLIGGAQVTITDAKSKQSIVTKSNDEGKFRVSGLAPGAYELLVEARNSKTFKVVEVSLSAKETVDFRLVLATGAVMMGVVAIDDRIDIPPPGTTIILQDFIRRVRKQ